MSVLCADEPANGPTSVNGVPTARLKVAAKIANTPLTLGLPAALLRADFDVVHTHLPTPWSADWSVLIAKLRRKRSVLTYYNKIPGKGIERWVALLYRNTVERLTMRLADVILLQSRSWERRLVEMRPSLADKLVVIANGVDTERFAPPPPSAPRNDELLFVSVLDRFHEYKGLDVLLDALPECPGRVLNIVGDGELRGFYEQRCRELGIAERVHFLGAVDDNRLVDLYRSCGLFVLSSNGGLHEGGSSLVVLEAMSCGLPVVVAQGAGDIANDAELAGAGLAVPASDRDAMAKAINALMSDSQRRAECSQAAADYIRRHHTWSAIVDQIAEQYGPAEGQRR